MSTKTHIGRQEEVINEVGVEFGSNNPTSPVNTQTWLNTSVPVLASDITSPVALNKNTTSILVPLLNLDAFWGKAYKIISADSAFTFSNFADGVKVELTVINSDLYNSHTISFPSLKFTNISSINLILAPSETAIYTFTQTNSVIYCSVIKGVYPLNQTWMWGNDNYVTGPAPGGQLGDGDINNKIYPVSIIGKHSFVNVTGGAYHSLGLKIDGSAWSWGVNYIPSLLTSGALGNNTTVNISSPAQVVGVHSFVNITCGYDYSLWLKQDGSVWTCGNNTFGRLGHYTTNLRSSPVVVVGSHSFINIASGFYMALGLKQDGSLWSWGQNSSGQLGLATDTNNRSSPVLVAGNHSFIKIVGGALNTFGLKVDGNLWSWGDNTYGQLGAAINTNLRSSPAIVLGGHSFINMASGQNHTLGLKADGTVWSWGYNLTGELGTFNSINRSSPVLVVGSHSFINITCGIAHSLGLKIDGNIWSWGQNTYGQLGLYDSIARSSPTQVYGNHSFINLFNTKGYFSGGLVSNSNNF